MAHICINTLAGFSSDTKQAQSVKHQSNEWGINQGSVHHLIHQQADTVLLLAQSYRHLKKHLPINRLNIS